MSSSDRCIVTLSSKYQVTKIRALKGLNIIKRLAKFIGPAFAEIIGNLKSFQKYVKTDEDNESEDTDGNEETDGNEVDSVSPMFETDVVDIKTQAGQDIIKAKLEEHSQQYFEQWKNEEQILVEYDDMNGMKYDGSKWTGG